MTIRTKLYILGVFLLLIMATMLWTASYSQHKYTKILDMMAGVDRAHVLILQARGWERDFFLSCDVAYRDLVCQQVEEIVSTIHALREMDDMTSEGRALIERVDHSVRKYLREFLAVAKLRVERGLDELSGLRGELNEAAQRMVSEIRQHGNTQLLLPLLLLRQHERTYQVSAQLTSIGELERGYAAFKKTLEETTLEGQTKGKLGRLGETYMSAMRQIVNKDAEIDARIDEFRVSIHRSEPLMKAFLDYVHGLSAARGRFTRRSILVTGILACALGAVAFFIVRRGLYVPFERLRNSLQKAADGESHDEESNSLLSRLESEGLLSTMARREVAAGHKLIAQGAEPDGFYIIESGKMTVQVEYEDGSTLPIATVRDGSIVGELGWYCEQNRTASVVTSEPCVIWHVSAAALAEMEKSHVALVAAFHRTMARILAARVIKRTATLNDVVAQL